MSLFDQLNIMQTIKKKMIDTTTKLNDGERVQVRKGNNFIVSILFIHEIKDEYILTSKNRKRIYIIMI